MTLRVESLLGGRGGFRLGPVDAEAPEGTLVALLGGNGSGKSTLLLTIAGILKAAAGTARWRGEDLQSLLPAARAARVALVPQRPVVECAFTVRECVELGRFALPRSPQAIRGALAACSLTGLEERLWHHLSEGQRQRVALARALAQHEEGGLLVLDEPFAAMDPASARRALELVRGACRRGATALVATHDLALAASADQVWILSEGSLAAAGAVAQVLTPAVLEPLLGVRVVMVDGVAPHPAPVVAWSDAGPGGAAGR